MIGEIKVLALLGSPRKGGNTEALLNAALEGARSAGASVENLWLKDVKVSPCIGCGACERTGSCAVQDDMQDLYKRIEQADRLILASPIYYYSISAWAKAVIDRFQQFWARKHVLEQPVREEGRDRWGAFIAVGATKGKRLFEGAILTVRYCFADAGFKYAGHVLIRGMADPGDVQKHPEHLTAAHELGRVLVLNPGTGYDYVV